MFLTSLTLLHLKTPTSSLPENTNKHAPPPPTPFFVVVEKGIVCVCGGGGGGGGRGGLFGLFLKISAVNVNKNCSPLSLHYVNYCKRLDALKSKSGKCVCMCVCVGGGGGGRGGAIILIKKNLPAMPWAWETRQQASVSGFWRDPVRVHPQSANHLHWVKKRAHQLQNVSHKHWHACTQRVGWKVHRHLCSKNKQCQHFIAVLSCRAASWTQAQDCEVRTRLTF